ncbi:MAG: ROK family protein [Chloroflexota bacterium]
MNKQCPDSTLPVIGVDLGGTNARAAIIVGARIIADVRRATPATSGAAAVNDVLLSAVAELLARPEGRAVSAIGLGIPGLIDVAHGVCRFSPNLHWRDEPVADLFHERFHLPVAMDNDVRVATFGELVFGAGRGVANFVCVTVGTGIGSGIVLGGRLYRGPGFAAGEVGHQTLEPSGRPCKCGSRGCLETLAAAPAIALAGREAAAAGRAPELARLSGGDPECIDASLVAKAAAIGDAGARAVLARAGEYLGIGLANIANILNPERIIVGGGVANAGELLLGPVRRALQERAMPVNRQMAEVVPAELGADAGLIGAGALARLAAQNQRWWEQ